MLFNSFTFAVFFPIVFIFYWKLPHRGQNYFLLAASYLFYGFWDWRFLSLIFISTLVDYITGIKIDNANQQKTDKNKKIWLIISLCTNLGILAYFKYFNFFIDSFSEIINSAGFDSSGWQLHIILPVGISFYTFQTMSYTIDIYRNKMKANHHFFDFALYVSFFPQLVAGPIERAKVLIPRILNKRTFNKNQFIDGIHLIFWGLWKKVFVADNLSPIVDRIFSMSTPSGFDVLVGAYAFAIQIYCDFSGYSDIARGCAKCLGFELMLNFRHPYVALNPSDFWLRWHISLSSWLRDYLYISLGGNKKGNIRTYINLITTMLLGGLWHGASWIFVVWGAYQGILLIGHRLFNPIFKATENISNLFPHSIRRFVKIFVMFQLVCGGWIIFRAESISQIKDMIYAIFTWRGVSDFSVLPSLLLFIGPLLIIEGLQVVLDCDEVYDNTKVPVWIKSIAYSMFFYLLVYHGASAQSFIYFQF